MSRRNSNLPGLNLFGTIRNTWLVSHYVYAATHTTQIHNRDAYYHLVRRNTISHGIFSSCDNHHTNMPSSAFILSHNQVASSLKRVHFRPDLGLCSNMYPSRNPSTVLLIANESRLRRKIGLLFPVAESIMNSEIYILSIGVLIIISFGLQDFWVTHIDTILWTPHNVFLVGWEILLAYWHWTPSLD